jgi:hypothetical protein
MLELQGIMAGLRESEVSLITSADADDLEAQHKQFICDVLL